MNLRYNLITLVLFISEAFLGIHLLYTLTSSHVAHIYVDPATTSALFQMSDVLNQPASDPKYIAWRRYMSFFPENLKSDLNVTTSSVTQNYSNAAFKRLVIQEVTKFYRRYPDYVFVIHANMSHTWLLNAVLQVIPPNKVKQIHLYEDAIGWTLWEKAASNFFKYRKWYSATYHASFVDEVVKKLPNLKKDIHNLTLDNLSKLSSFKKEQLYALAGLHTDSVAPLFRNRPIAIFFDDCNLNANQVSPFFEKRLKTDPRLKNLTWLYKNHPRCNSKGPFYNKLTQYTSDVHILQPQMPWEILLVADLIPDYVCGYSSSSFFSVKPNQILFYIERPNDKYLPILKKWGFVSDSNIIFQKDMNATTP